MKISLLLLVVALSATTIFAQESPSAQKAKPVQPASLAPVDKMTNLSPAERYFSDVELLDQDGKKLRFYSDILKNKVVVINTFFTTCTSICPPLNRNFEKMQDALGDRLGKDAFLVSISVDPETDTPTRLKDYGRAWKRTQGTLEESFRPCEGGRVDAHSRRRHQRSVIRGVRLTCSSDSCSSCYSLLRLAWSGVNDRQFSRKAQRFRLSIVNSRYRKNVVRRFISEARARRDRKSPR